MLYAALTTLGLLALVGMVGWRASFHERRRQPARRPHPEGAEGYFGLAGGASGGAGCTSDAGVYGDGGGGGGGD
jgi:hypothetical protein